MPLDWIDVTDISFRTLLLLEREQLAWLPGWLSEPELAVALRANPEVEWYLRNKNPDLAPWVDRVMATDGARVSAREAEQAILGSMIDLVTYAVDPQRYADLPFLGWDDAELTDLVDFRGRTVIDVGAGTGRLAFVAAEAGAHAVFAVEPVENLRHYMRERGASNVHVVDGLITDLPFPTGFADVVMGGHVYGDARDAEYTEMARVTRPGGLLILCPGGNDVEDDRHRFLVDRGFEWARFEEPGDGWKRKYWKTL